MPRFFKIPSSTRVSQCRAADWHQELPHTVLCTVNVHGVGLEWKGSVARTTMHGSLVCLHEAGMRGGIEAGSEHSREKKEGAASWLAGWLAGQPVGWIEAVHQHQHQHQSGFRRVRAGEDHEGGSPDLGFNPAPIPIPITHTHPVPTLEALSKPSRVSITSDKTKSESEPPI
ncbi:predicted protein [Plenodomus lingam JN3]|uniref:Predicted protein n=1 Tax=Leptosphaeria maculans (strain JN3 / isolate v23.1.3 / race Av1-4-5-6-7-8) TaxID=985895 RepID=E5A9L5_LEPMJ|nr:predicted protein [Plenodomus lingam JN3]CBY00356.1 predicted protein [Plenodomus lingam JN3]